MAPSAKKKQSGEPTYRARPPVSDYSDDVTDQHRERIRSLVDPREYEDAEVIDGPAW